MSSPLVGHPKRLEPFKNFISFIAKASGTILITGPTGSGKKRIADFLVEEGLLSQAPVLHLNGLLFSEELWGRSFSVLQSQGTLVMEDFQYLPLALQARFKNWLTGQKPLLSEGKALPSEWRIIVVGLRPEDLWEELLYQFTYHIHLPSLNEIIEDIPYHIKHFLHDKPIRYLRYFFLLKLFHHQWQGNIRELEQCLSQALAYYQSYFRVESIKDGDEIFGEKRLRYYQDILNGEWWYFPYRFLPGFSENIPAILNETDFRAKILQNRWVLPLLAEEPGFLVFDLNDPEFEEKATAVYHCFSEYLKKKTSG